ncbi:MAG: hypothetical protein H7Z72_07620 [Bacteroidetes bacterium]|nr:hypothetical protein [Fibrella sp.]
MHSDFDWSRPLDWAIAGAMVAVLVLQVWLLIRSQSLSGVRRSLRIVLNGLLWLVLVGYVLQPFWYDPSPATHALLVGDEVPSAQARDIQASLGIPERFTPRNFIGTFATVTLLGQSVPTPLLSRLSGSDVRWIPYEVPDQLQVLHWKGIVRQGELQRVSGRIQSSRKQWLHLRYGSQTLDSVSLGAGNQAFALHIPAFVLGRTQLELTLASSSSAANPVGGISLGGTPLDTIRFFARPAEAMAYQIILDNPDFETKTLADWLGRTGQSVQLTTTVSTNVRNSLTINQSRPRTPDVIITDPGNAANPAVKRAISEGKRVLFINLTDPEADLRTINQALGSRFSVRKLANVETVPVGKNLTALPFQFNPSLRQQLVPGYPVAVQRTVGTVGTVGVSLLSETFPLMLRGDSTAYARLWYALLAPFQPPGRNNVLVDAPVFSGLAGTFRINNATEKRAFTRVGNDTARVTPSSINPVSAEGRYRFSRAGWVPVADSLAVFVEEPQRHSVGRNQLVGSYVRAHNGRTGGTRGATLPTESTVPEWVWFVLLLSCFTALWIEPKLG